MTKFKLNKNYNHKLDKINLALGIDEKREEYIIDQIGTYWDSLTPEKFMISKILDFIEQQDWTTIEKLYVTERFTTFNEEEIMFGNCDEELIDYIVKTWKEKGSVVDEEETRTYIKHMFKLLIGYNLNCLIDTLKDIDNLAIKFGEINKDEYHDNEIVMTPEQIEEQRKNILMNNAIQNIDRALPDSFGVAIFCKSGYNIIGKTPEMAKLIQDTLISGQKNFIADKDSNVSLYQ